MPDREKVIRGLECIKGDLVLCVDCAYSDSNGHGGYHCKAFCAKDAIELLKEQEDLGTELTNAMELVRKKNERIKKLEEQIDYYKPEEGEPGCLTGKR